MSERNYPMVNFRAEIEIRCAFCDNHFKLPVLEETKETGYTGQHCPFCGATYNADVEIDFYE